MEKKKIVIIKKSCPKPEPPVPVPVPNIKLCDENIQAYLDTLNINVTEISLIGHGLTKIPSLVRFVKLNKFVCKDNLLTELPEFGAEIKQIYCMSNKLKELNILKYANLGIVDCSCNNIIRIDGYPDSMHTIIASNNALTSVPEHNNLYYAKYCNNNLTTLPRFTSKLWKLKCNNNKISQLPRFHDDTYLELSCSNNPLTKLPAIRNQNTIIRAVDTLLMTVPIPKDIYALPIAETQRSYGYGQPDYFIDIRNTPISEILGMCSVYIDDIEDRRDRRVVKRVVNECNILERFQFVYYVQKCRKKLMRFLWKKIRLPKIQYKYRPERLLDIMDQIQQDTEYMEELFNTIENENNW